MPLPDSEKVNLLPPDVAEARLIAGGVAGAVAPGYALTSLQRLMIEALIESMTGYVVPATAVPRLGPEEFARAMSARRRVPLAHGAVHVALCVGAQSTP